MGFGYGVKGCKIKKRKEKRVSSSYATRQYKLAQPKKKKREDEKKEEETEKEQICVFFCFHF